jgi:hypothetical protein
MIISQRRNLTWFEPYPAPTSDYLIPSESLSLSAQSVAYGPVYFAILNESLNLTEQTPGYAVNIAVPAIALSLNTATPTYRFDVSIPASALSLTEFAPTFSPYYLIVPAIPLTLESNSFSLVYEFDIPASALTFTTNPVRLPTFSIHQNRYSSFSLGWHHTGYQSPEIVALHESSWTQTAQSLFTAIYESIVIREAQSLHTALYQSTGTSSVSNAHTTTYQSTGLSAVSTYHDCTYDSFIRIPGYAVHEVLWNSVGTSLVMTVHEAGYASIGSSVATTIHATTYQSIGSASAFTSHATTYRSLPLAVNAHQTAYKAISATFGIHTAQYQSTDTLTPYALHDARYRSFSMDAQTVLANAYIEPDIQIIAAQVTADEGSPYYQCEIELRNAKDYQAFVRDQAFVLHLLNDEYHFLVDSKGLSRSMDDAGNYQEVATLTGLSPLCAKANPRAQPITKTWEVPTFASVIVEELIGAVTWNLVDWQIPAYRLSVEKAEPLEVAQQIVNAAGGLIESQPDGSVVIRHRWPVSIAQLDRTSADTTLYEESIYAANESPTNDDLMNYIRILDSNANYQDRLEYVPNREGDNDDPWNGMLYAFPSPWREGLRIATTRGSVIQIGNQNEGVRTIADSNDDYPAETLTFESGQSSTQYPIQSLLSLDWLDENLGGLTFTPYATTVEASQSGNYQGYSLAKVEYTTRYLSVPVACTPSTDTIEAQFLLLENTDGE